MCVVVVAAAAAAAIAVVVCAHICVSRIPYDWHDLCQQVNPKGQVLTECVY